MNLSKAVRNEVRRLGREGYRTVPAAELVFAIEIGYEQVVTERQVRIRLNALARQGVLFRPGRAGWYQLADASRFWAAQDAYDRPALLYGNRAVRFFETFEEARLELIRRTNAVYEFRAEEAE